MYTAGVHDSDQFTTFLFLFTAATKQHHNSCMCHLLKVLAMHKYHSIFSLEGERGETSLVKFAIDTRDTVPKNKQLVEYLMQLGKKLIANWQS